MDSTGTLINDAGNDQQLQEEQEQRENKDLKDVRTCADEEQVRRDLKLSLVTIISAAACLFSIFVAELSSAEDSRKHKEKNICVSFLVATISSGAAAVILVKQYHRFEVPIEILIKTLTYTSLICLLSTLGYVGFVLVKLLAIAAFLLAIFLPTLLAFVAFRFYKKINEAPTNQNISPSLQMAQATTSAESSIEHTAVAIAVHEEKEDVD